MIRYLRLVPLALLLALAGCGGPAGEPPPSTTVQTAQASELTPPEQAFVDQVAGIAAPLAENPERLARRGTNTCDSLTDGRPREDAVAQAVDRFSGGSYTVTTEEAAAIVDAAEQTVCAS